MTSQLDSCPALVLNADFRPLSYFPLSLWSWQDAVKAVFLDRVNIIDHYDEYVRSPREDTLDQIERRLDELSVLRQQLRERRDEQRLHDLEDDGGK